MTTIVGVHGIGNHRPGHPPSVVAAHLAEVWTAALLAGAFGTLPPDVALTFAYYAHHLRPDGTQGGDDLDRLPPAAQIIAAELLDILEPDSGTPQGRLTRSLRQDLAAFATRKGFSRRVVEGFVTTFVVEVARYLDPTTHQRFLARTEVSAAIAAANSRSERTIVIAHSLGSVVTYETLHAYPHLVVDDLITIGSPLALPRTIYHRLEPAPDPRGTRPANVRRWTNIADVGDVIAIPPRGVRDSFDGVDTDYETAIHWADFHLAANYLKTTELAQALRTSLGQP